MFNMIIRIKKKYGQNPRTRICENSKFLKSIVDESVVTCNEIINATDDIPTNMTNVTNTIPTNVTSTVSINSGDKKVRYKMDSYILLALLLVIILLFMIAITCYHYTKYRSKQKRITTQTI